MTGPFSQRSEVEPFHAMDVLAKATQKRRAGEDIAFLCVGQPAAPAPKAALDATRAMLQDGVVSYTDAGGRLDLQQALSAHMECRYGVSVGPHRIFITTGSSAGFNLAFLTLFNPGDRVAIAAPGYPAYRNIMKALSLDVVEIATGAETRHALSPELLLAEHQKAHLAGVLVASPANPTGTMMAPEALQAIVAFCDDAGIRFISDEIYHGLAYSEETGIAEQTALAFSDDVIVINSFSKYYCMTGWRIGWMVLPQAMVRPVERLAQSLYISAPELSQVAAVEALTAVEELEAVKRGYAQNRALLLERLPAMGFASIMPVDGAFYAYADASPFTNDTMQLAHALLDKAGVAATPGLDFDPMNGQRMMRFSFAGDFPTMTKAMDRMETFLRGD